MIKLWARFSLWYSYGYCWKHKTQKERGQHPGFSYCAVCRNAKHARSIARRNKLERLL